MATIADELLNDFGDSSDEDEAQVDEKDFSLDDTADGTQSGLALPQDGSMILDDDEEAPDEDNLDGTNVPSHLRIDEDETAEETKARIDKMELQNVSDVRSVAGLMRQLDPLLGVSTSPPAPSFPTFKDPRR